MMETTLPELLHELGTASLLDLWLPVVIWTLVAMPAYLYLRWKQPGTPLVRYRAFQALLLSLPAGLAATNLSGLLGSGPTTTAFSAPPVILPPSISAAGSPAAPPLWDPYSLLGLFTLLAAALALWRLGRLGTHAAALMRFRSRLPSSPSALHEQVQELAGQLGVRRSVRAALLDDTIVPMTFGTWQPVIVLPARLAEDTDKLRMTLTHELVHVKRHDYAAQWLEQLVTALLAVHPGVALLGESIAVHREMACDAEVVDQIPSRRSRYANLLYDAAVTAQPPFTAVGLGETSDHLKQRIEALTTHVPSAWHHKHLALTLGVALLLGTAGTFAACSDLVGLDREEPASSQEQIPKRDKQDKEVFVAVEDPPHALPNNRAGMKQLAECLQYPAAAKAAGIEGRVIVQFIISPEGDVTRPTVVSGKGGGLDAEAVRCVKQLAFEPGRQRGQAVPVRFSLPVNFTLNDGSDKPRPQSQRRDDATATGAGDEVFVEVDDPPHMLPSNQAGMKQLAECLQYPAAAKAAGVEGRVIVQFVVSPEGEATDLEVISSQGGGLDAEALRCVSQLEFEPGRLNGEAVPVKFALPVNFTLDSGDGGQETGHSTYPSSDAVIHIARNGDMTINGKETTLEDLPADLRRIGANRVAVNVASQATMGRVEDVQDAIRQSGPLKISYRSS